MFFAERGFLKTELVLADTFVCPWNQPQNQARQPTPLPESVRGGGQHGSPILTSSTSST